MNIVNDFPDEIPHTLIIGLQGSGKTTIAQALAVTRTGTLAILDPRWRPGMWGGLPVVTVDEDGGYTQLEEAIKALLTELNIRLVSLNQGTTEFEELTIIADELPTLISECPSTGALMTQILGRGQEVSVRLLGISEREDLAGLVLPSQGSITIRLGETAAQVVPEVQSREYPAVLPWRGEHFMIDLSGMLHLSRIAIPLSRSWSFPGDKSRLQPQNQPQTEPISDPQVARDERIPVAFEFTAEEVGRIAVSIIQGVERSKAIRAMPGYSRKQHRTFALFYDTLKAILMESDAGELPIQE
jgi:hypothetical protein